MNSIPHTKLQVRSYVYKTSKYPADRITTWIRGHWKQRRCYHYGWRPGFGGKWYCWRASGRKRQWSCIACTRNEHIPRPWLSELWTRKRYEALLIRKRQKTDINNSYSPNFTCASTLYPSQRHEYPSGDSKQVRKRRRPKHRTYWGNINAHHEKNSLRCDIITIGCD